MAGATLCGVLLFSNFAFVGGRSRMSEGFKTGHTSGVTAKLTIITYHAG